MFLIYSNQQNNKTLSERANQYKYSANQRNVVRKSVVASNTLIKKKIDCYKAIVLLTDLLEKHMINKKDYDELIIKYQDNINKIDKPTIHQKIDPYRALYELNQIKEMIKEEEDFMVHSQVDFQLDISIQLGLKKDGNLRINMIERRSKM